MSERKEPQKNTSEKKIKPPYTFRERVLYKIAKGILNLDHFSITDDLIELGMDDVMIDVLAEGAAEKGICLSAEDIKKHRTIEKIIRGTNHICKWLDGFDPEKPVLVLVHGVTSDHFFMPVMEGLKMRFSILSIEPIVEHYRHVFPDARIQEAVDFYGDMIRTHLPEGTSVFGFIGHSFGGDIAYRLGVQWAKQLGEFPFVYMLDTYLRVYDAEHFEEYRKKLLDKFDAETRTKVQAYWMSCAYFLNVAKKLGDGKALPAYDGPVRLFSAMQIKEEPTLATLLPVKAVMRGDNPNVKAWKKLAHNLIVEYIDADHMTIVNASEFSEIFFRHIDKDLSRAISLPNHSCGCAFRYSVNPGTSLDFLPRPPFL